MPYEVELPTEGTKIVNDRGTRQVTRDEMEEEALKNAIRYFSKAFLERYGTRPSPRINRRFFLDDVRSSMRHILRELHPELRKEWRALPDFGKRQEFLPSSVKVFRTAQAFVDWLFSNHFSKVTAGALTSEHWVSQYCIDVVAQRRRKQKPTDAWTPDANIKPIGKRLPSKYNSTVTDSWED